MAGKAAGASIGTFEIHRKQRVPRRSSFAVHHREEDTHRNSPLCDPIRHHIFVEQPKADRSDQDRMHASRVLIEEKISAALDAMAVQHGRACHNPKLAGILFAPPMSVPTQVARTSAPCPNNRRLQFLAICA